MMVCSCISFPPAMRLSRTNCGRTKNSDGRVGIKKLFGRRISNRSKNLFEEYLFFMCFNCWCIWPCTNQLKFKLAEVIHLLKFSKYSVYKIFLLPMETINLTYAILLCSVCSCKIFHSVSCSFWPLDCLYLKRKHKAICLLLFFHLITTALYRIKSRKVVLRKQLYCFFCAESSEKRLTNCGLFWRYSTLSNL